MMAAVLDRLQSLRVSDVMNRAVVAVYGHQTMGEAAEVFAQHGISGAPVLDEHGRCVGVLSARDFVGGRSKPDPAAASIAAENTTVVREAPNSRWELKDAGPDRVAAHMTPAVQSVAAQTPLVEAGRMMCAQHIHRLPVLDDNGRPQGMLTSLDIVAAVVKAVEEQQR
jgi:CBS-domain-containing membrane protein